MNTKNWRIDHNGFVTSEIIRKGEDPHGKREISDDLMRLLSIYRKDKRFPTIVQQNDDFHDTTSGFYQIEPDLEVKYIISKDVSTLESYGIINYMYELPLWYIIYCYLQTFHEGESKHTLDSIKQGSKKELNKILDNIGNNNKETHINHDVRAIIGGSLYNIGL